MEVCSKMDIIIWKHSLPTLAPITVIKPQMNG